MSAIEQKNDCIEVRLRVMAKAKKERIELSEDFLKVWVCEVREKGKANKAVIKLLAKKLSLPKSAISIIAGHTCQTKILRIKGINSENLLTALGKAGL